VHTLRERAVRATFIVSNKPVTKLRQRSTNKNQNRLFGIIN